ncbi:MAG TPA: glycosyltransferase family 39 protein [Methyloceanibacter sp.]|nr:glycosyltransferase family 39 protein [Methyloceanibacter sp.]
MSVQAPFADEMAGKTDSPSWPFNLAGVVSVGLLYGLVYASMRLALSHNLPQDDVTSNVFTQTLEPGYVLKQPPLYEWLLWSVQRFTGPTLPSFLILKYGLLTATFALLYLVAKRIFADQRWAALAALSPLLLYHIGWNLHEGVTQTMALICAVAATMWSFMRLVERGRAFDYVLFGAIAGLGLLSKYSFAGFLVVLLGSALLQPALRERLLDWRVLLSAGAAALVTAPFVYWLIEGSHDLVAFYGSAMAPMAETDRLKATLIGLGKAIYAPLAFLFPLDLIVLLVFPRALREGWTEIKLAVRPQTFSVSEPDWRLLLLHITIGGFLLLMIGALSTGATHYLERYMHPFFLLTALWLVGLVEKSGNPARRLAVLGTILLAVTLIVMPVRLRDALHAMGPECRKCRIAVPYEGLAAALQARGFHDGTLIAADRHDAGNLRHFFPQVRIVRVERPAYAPPMRAADLASKVAVVWRKGSDRRLPKEAQSEFEKVAGGMAVTPERVRVPWQPFPPGSAGRVWDWVIVVADPKQGSGNLFLGYRTVMAIGQRILAKLQRLTA